MNQLFQPIGYINAEMLNRKREFEKHGMVMFDRPCGTATMPLYAESPSARITGDKDGGIAVEGTPYGEGLIGRIDALEAENARLRSAMLYISELGYVAHQSGDQNFEALQSLMRQTLADMEQVDAE